jgi:hypothetical protein
LCISLGRVHANELDIFLSVWSRMHMLKDVHVCHFSPAKVMCPSAHPHCKRNIPSPHLTGNLVISRSMQPPTQANASLPSSRTCHTRSFSG